MNEKMKVTEVAYELQDRGPEICDYCGERRSFLMQKPARMAYKGKLILNYHLSGPHPWTCLECFSLDVDAAGHSVEVYEYDV